MFMFPEPPPIDYYITDVTSSYLTDGVFHHGKQAPTHKYIAKQLKPMKRAPSDPVAPVQELDPRALSQWIEKEKEGCVDPCGQDDGRIYETLEWMPRWKRDRRTTEGSLLPIFPRSPQYELRYVRDRRRKDAAKHNVAVEECSKRQGLSEDKEDSEPCGFIKPPFWWKDKSGKPGALPVGNINDYAYESLKEFDLRDTKISERLQMDHPRKYIPGVIHRQKKSPEDTSMTDVLDRADAFKVVLKIDETLAKDASPVHKCTCPSPRPPRRDSMWDQDARNADKTLLDSDRRWQPLYEKIGFSGTNVERQEELRQLTKPFLHDLHAWYSKNKPTKLMLPLRYPGKKPHL